MQETLKYYLIMLTIILYSCSNECKNKVIVVDKWSIEEGYLQSFASTNYTGGLRGGNYSHVYTITRKVPETFTITIKDTSKLLFNYKVDKKDFEIINIGDSVLIRDVWRKWEINVNK